MVSNGTCKGASIIIPGLLPSILPLDPLMRVGPSHFPTIKKCKLRAIWDSSSNVQPLLPPPPSAHIGIVIHKLLEMAGKGEITGDESFNSAWISCIQHEEAKMISFWTEKHLVPLEKSARNCEVKKFQCLRTVQRLAKVTKPAPERFIVHNKKQEVWVQTSDGKIGGYVDAIVPTESGDLIIDYKTGVTLEPEKENFNPEVLENYQIQLKLYAALYESTYGKWPASIVVVGMDGVFHEIHFSHEECSNLLHEAYRSLDEINLIITDKKESYSVALNHLASPSPEICRFCLYRPCCLPYWKKRDIEPEAEWPCDAKGTIEEKKIMGNGLMLLKLMSHAGKSFIVKLRGIHMDRHPALTNDTEEVSIFSMIPGKVLGSYSEGPLTTIYKYSEIIINGSLIS